MKEEKAFAEYDQRIKEVILSGITDKKRNDLQKEIAKKYKMRVSDFRDHLIKRALGI